MRRMSPRPDVPLRPAAGGGAARSRRDRGPRSGARPRAAGAGAEGGVAAAPAGRDHGRGRGGRPPPHDGPASLGRPRPGSAHGLPADPGPGAGMSVDRLGRRLPGRAQLAVRPLRGDRPGGDLRQPAADPGPGPARSGRAARARRRRLSPERSLGVLLRRHARRLDDPGRGGHARRAGRTRGAAHPLRADRADGGRGGRGRLAHRRNASHRQQRDRRRGRLRPGASGRGDARVRLGGQSRRRPPRRACRGATRWCRR